MAAAVQYSFLVQFMAAAQADGTRRKLGTSLAGAGLSSSRTVVRGAGRGVCGRCGIGCTGRGEIGCGGRVWIVWGRYVVDGTRGVGAGVGAGVGRNVWRAGVGGG